MLLVLTPAPKVRRHETSSPVEHWTQTFLVTSAPRTRLGLLPLMWLLVVCTVVFPVGVWSRSEVATNASKVTAHPDNQPVVQTDEDVKEKFVDRQTEAQLAGSASRASSETVSTEKVSTEPAVNKTEDTAQTAAVETQTQAPVSTTEHTDAAVPPATVNAGAVATEATSTEANSSKATSTEATSSSAALPNIPNPDLGLNAGVPAPASKQRVVRSFKVRAVVSGKTRTGTVKLPAGATVAQALLEMGISVGSLDRVAPLAKEKAFNGMTVRVTRIRADVRTRTVKIEPQSVFQLTPNLASGREELVQKPQSGVVEITERVWSKDGRVTMHEMVGRKVKQQAKDRVVAIGVRSYYMPGRVPYHNRYARAYDLSSRSGSPRDRMGVAPVAGKTMRAVRCITLTATGYSPDPRENGGYSTTATGLPIGYGAAAVDPRVVPLGTKMYIEGYGYAFACDTGGAIKGSRIDLAYDSYYLANTKGRKKVKVWILGE
jgi:3D (Asp-Asp-Asp) domain-containing protein